MTTPNAPKVVTALPGPNGKRVLEKDARYMSPSYTRCYPLVVSRAEYRGDFETLSFRSNLVLRWEWRRGSTLFLIWQRDLGSNERSSRLVRPGDLADALGAG